jgi:hypothetical protein
MYIPTNSVWEFLFPHLHYHLLSSVFLIIAILTWVRLILGQDKWKINPTSINHHPSTHHWCEFQCLDSLEQMSNALTQCVQMNMNQPNNAILPTLRTLNSLILSGHSLLSISPWSGFGKYLQQLSTSQPSKWKKKLIKYVSLHFFQIAINCRRPRVSEFF